MRELVSYRRAWLEFAQKAAGVVRGERLVTLAQVANIHADHDTSRLPETVEESPLLQAAGGAHMFMIDVTLIDSPFEPIG